jgi:hypothetical protein
MAIFRQLITDFIGRSGDLHLRVTRLASKTPLFSRGVISPVPIFDRRLAGPVFTPTIGHESWH